MAQFVDYAALVANWSDDDLVAALEDSMYEELGIGDKSVADLALDELLRRQALREKWDAQASDRSMPPLVDNSKPGTPVPTTPPTPIDIDDNLHPFAAKRKAEAWLEAKWFAYAQLKRESTAAWVEANEYLDETVRWRRELEDNHINWRRNAAWRGYQQLANTLHTDAIRKLHRARTFHQTLRKHEERFFRRFGRYSASVFFVDDTDQNELTTLQAMYRGVDWLEAPSGGVTINDVEYPEGERPSPNIDDYICYCCRSRMTTSYPDPRCRNFDCAKYDEPMITLARFRDAMAVPRYRDELDRIFELHLQQYGFVDLLQYREWVDTGGTLSSWLVERSRNHTNELRELNRGRIAARLRARRHTRTTNNTEAVAI